MQLNAKHVIASEDKSRRCLESKKLRSIPCDTKENSVRSIILRRAVRCIHIMRENSHGQKKAIGVRWVLKFYSSPSR